MADTEKDVTPHTQKPNDQNEDGSDNFSSPFDFSLRKKWLITITVALTTFTCTFASSIFSAAVAVVAKEYHVSETIGLLGVSLYVLGFAVGPIAWGPFSEIYGRRLPFFIAYLGFTILQIPSALAPNLPGILICRFLSGCFGAGPIALASALYSDFWNPAERGVASAVFSVAIYAGPTIGPIAGSFIVESHLGWRWTSWITLIISCVIGVLAFFCVPETYMPVLKERARRLTAESNNEVSSLALTQTKSPAAQDVPNNFIRKFLFKPLTVLTTEPMLLAMTVYTAAAYGILYLTFYAFPYSFTIERHWKPQIGALPFLSMLVGILSACLFVALYSRYYYLPRLRKRRSVLPEDRLPPIMIGSILLPVGLFWFAWTSSPDILWVPQVLSAYLIGAGIMLIFSNGIAYIIDVYLKSAASAVAANTFFRSAVAAGLPLAGPQMYHKLGTAWATTVLGLICVALIPVPFLFYKFGAKLRGLSKYAKQPS